MVVGKWAWPWSQQVFMVDASLSGFSIERSVWSYGDISKVGRVKERRRYKMGAQKARRNALTLGGFALDEHGGLLRDSLSDYVKVPKDIQVELDAAGYDVDP